MPYDLPNDLRLRALGNKEILKISNLGRDIAHLGREIALVVMWEKHFFFLPFALIVGKMKLYSKGLDFSLKLQNLLTSMSI